MKTLQTTRLILRKWLETDLDDLYECAKNPNIGPSAGWKPHADKEESLKILKSFIEGEEVWAIVLKETGNVIGSIGLHGEKRRTNPNARMIGYVLSEDYWGRGLMTEAVKCVIRHGFEDLDLTIISIYHFPFNTRSKSVIEKAGFQYEGTLRQDFTRYDGEVFDSLCYSITKDEFKKENNIK